MPDQPGRHADLAELVDPAGWMRAPDPVGQLGVLQAAVFTDRRLRLRYRSSGHREPEVSGQEAGRSPLSG